MGFFMNHPGLGFSYFLDGFSLITKPGVRRFVIIPLIINILLFIGLFFLLRYFVGEFNVWFAQHLPKWLHWLSTILWLLFFISFFIIIIYTFVTIANLVSAPFNSFLSEKVELYLMGHVFEERTLMDNIKDIPYCRPWGLWHYWLLCATCYPHIDFIFYSTYSNDSTDFVIFISRLVYDTDLH